MIEVDVAVADESDDEVVALVRKAREALEALLAVANSRSLTISKIKTLRHAHAVLRDEG